MCFVLFSWQIPKPVALARREERGEDKGMVLQQMDNSSTDGNIPKLEVEIKAEGDDEGEDEFLSHSTVTWDQPRRLANH